MRCDVTSMIFAYQTNVNISRTKQGNEVLEKLYFISLNDLQHAIIKSLSQISLHKHFKEVHVEGLDQESVVHNCVERINGLLMTWEAGSFNTMN